MPFDDETRKKLKEVLKDKESIESYFEKNRLKMTNDLEESAKAFDDYIKLKDTDESKNLLEIIKIASNKNYETIVDTIYITRLAFLHSIETRNQLKETIDILRKYETDKEKMNDALNEFSKKIEDLSKHEQNLEWIDKFFKKSGVTP